MNWKKICRSVLCLLLVCCLVLHMSPLEAKAVDPITISMGIVAGVSAILGIGSIMIALGVMPKKTTQGKMDFWNLADRVYEGLPDSIKAAYFIEQVVGGQVQKLVKAWYYNDRYYFSEKLLQAINTFLYTGDVIVDTSTGKVTSSAPISYTPDFSSNASVAAAYATCLTYMQQNYPGVFSYCTSAPYCTFLDVLTGDQIWFTSDKPDADGDFFYYDLSGSFKAFELQSDGTWKVITKFPISPALRDTYAVSSEYRTTLALELGRVNSKVIPIDGTGALKIEPEYGDGDGGDGDEDDDGDDGGRYHPIIIPPKQEDIEDMDQDDAQDGSVDIDLAPGIDLDTGGIISPLSNRIQVAVDPEIAVASILVALGISPGSSNADFRTLVSNVIAELPEEYFYIYDSLAYGSLKLMRCWLCDGTYYFTGAVMEYINSLIYYGSDTMDPIFSSGGFNVDAGKYSLYPDFVTLMDSYRASSNSNRRRVAAAFDNALYFYSCCRLSDNAQWFAASSEPFVFDGGGTDYIKVFCSGEAFYASFLPVYGSWDVFPLFDSSKARVHEIIGPDDYVFETYEPGISVDGDFAVYDSSPDLSELFYQFITVFISGIKVFFYPVKLFDTLAEAEIAVQSEVQTGKDSSTWITVNVETGEIVDVIPEPAPDPDPDPTSPVPGPGTGGDPGTDPDPDPDPEPDPGTDPDDHSGLLSGLWEFFKWLGNFIVSGFRSIIEWLANTLVTGYRRVTEWLADTLLAGIRNIIEWLADAVLSGIREIFVPSEDFLTAKVQALRGRFGFADSVITTVSVLGAALMDFSKSPPIIYMDLSSSESKYDWGDRAIALDLRWYERYKPTVDALLSALLWVFFVWRVFRKLPGIISGMAGDSAFDSAGDGGSGSNRLDS